MKVVYGPNMNRRQFNLYIATAVVWLLFGCNNNRQGNESHIPSPENTLGNAAIDILALFSSNPIVKLLKFLKIVNDAIEGIEYEKSNNTVSFKTNNSGVTGSLNLFSDENGYCIFQTPSESIEFSPTHFLNVNDISFGDEDKLRDVDSKLIDAYTECTDTVLNSGENNHVVMLNLRIQCLEYKGYGKVNLDYMKVKYENYKMYQS